MTMPYIEMMTIVAMGSFTVGYLCYLTSTGIKEARRLKRCRVRIAKLAAGNF